MMRRALRSALVPLAAIGLLAAACGDDDDAASDTTPGTVTGSDVSGTIVVFAAASLTDSFTEIGETFMTEHPGTTVTFNFAGSSDLVAQIDEGAPSDVFASADQANMAKLTDAAGTTGDPQVFATNSLEIAVEPGNPLGITDVADLADPDLIVVTTDPDVPIGAYTQDVFANAGITVTPDSLEENVKAVLDKVVLGEADAGVVYATDVRSAGDTVTGVAIPADINVTPAYPIAATAEAPNPDGAAAFVDFVLGAGGQDILQRNGFLAP